MTAARFSLLAGRWARAAGLAFLLATTACHGGSSSSTSGSASGSSAASAHAKTPKDKLVEQILQLQSALDASHKKVVEAEQRGAPAEELAALHREEDAITHALQKAQSILTAMDEVQSQPK